MPANYSYNSIKLELADAVRGIMHLARLRRHAEQTGAAQELLARLAEDRFQLAVVGRFNVGKSSLMNAVLGQTLLPTGVRPLTSVITSVCYGSRAEIEVSFRNRTLPVRAKVEDIAHYATEEGNPANEKEAQSVLVRAPLEPLRNGFYFVDTPGIGSDILANTATTERFLPEADAVIFVTSFESAMMPEETDFLCRVRKQANKIFYVINKLDLIDEADQAHRIAEVRHCLEDQTGESESLRLFAVSARDGLEGKRRGDTEQVEASRMPQLEEALWEFLTEGKTREFLTRIADRTRGLIEQERFYVNLGLGADGKVGMFGLDVQSKLSEASSTLVRAADAKVRARLPGALEGDATQWFEQTTSSILETGSNPDEIAIRHRLAESWEAWSQSHIGTLASRLVAVAGEEIRQILTFHDRAKKLASELFAIVVPPPLNSGMDLLERTRVHFAAAPEPAQVASEWWQFGNRGRVKAVERAVRAYAEEIRKRTVEAGLDWIERLSAEAWVRCEEELANLRSAIEAETAHLDAVMLEKLEDELGSVRRSIDSLGSIALPSSSPGGPIAYPVRCAICTRVAKQVYDLLSKEQYALATDHDRQTAHAGEGGFCPLHAWQYEAIASPQGLCLAYAPLLENEARRLDAAAEDSNGAPKRRTECRICRFIGEREQACASELAAKWKLADVIHDGICLLHLPDVLRAGLPRSKAQALLREQARILQRCAEDMKMYALKHDAIRRHLVTEEERTAYYRGLAWVAGERTLALPWREEQSLPS